MIYVPDLENYKCFVVRDEETIRAYKEIPMEDTEVAYRDYYYNSNYLYSDGTQQFSHFTTVPTCLDSSVLTSAYVYRNDFFEILFIFLGMVGFCWFFISKLIKTFFRGHKKL